jgi:hypothetical protein
MAKFNWYAFRKPKERPMRFVLTIQLGNDAAQTYRDVARMLSELAERHDDVGEADYQIGDAAPIRDTNGNRVGSWHVDGGE